MADYTAIYEAGESLAELLRRDMCPEPVAKKESIGLCEPQEPEDFQVTVWLYNIEEQNEGGAAAGYIPDELDPGKQRYAPMQVRLSLLVSVHSKAPSIQRSADELRLLGKALQTVRDNPVLPKSVLIGSLAEQREPVTLDIARLTAEEVARIWNNSNKTIKPSFGVKMRVQIQSNRVRETGARVTSVQFDTRQKNGEDHGS